MRGNEPLVHVLEALKSLGGYFTFTDDAGEEYVIVRKDELGSVAHEIPQEVQLEFPPAAAPASADELLERINRDIAMYHEAHDQDMQDEFEMMTVATIDIDAENEEPGSDDTAAPLPPPRRVRFEPLRGDLPPELQE